MMTTVATAVDFVELRQLCREHALYKKWQTRYMNALKIKRDGEEQKKPTECKISDEYKSYLKGKLLKVGVQLAAVELQIVSAVHDLPAWQHHYSAVKGVGELTIGYCESYIDLEKATDDNGLVTISKVWTFTGYGDRRDHCGQKGEKRKFCAPLNTQLWQLGLSMKRRHKMGENKYGKIYEDRKLRHENSDQRRYKDAEEKPWREQPKWIIDSDAIRIMVKTFVADYVLVRAALEGRKVRAPYAEEYLGKKHSA